jgi:hypothetical protein
MVVNQRKPEGQRRTGRERERVLPAVYPDAMTFRREAVVCVYVCVRKRERERVAALDILFHGGPDSN